ncbi:(deoxy)nucleoside triphosphate pyrophosphohydrolase [Sporosarcina cyprini]|uniref:(deoxy)nucleoside triphosphate pyrophosphohydrolase n=1 Tax=Sporosarcina cyprini TaxID=2910523 RepID=UPI001EDF1CAA|nr:(deoxy)nucleoside triphosphate pyrophosphohydrolase [Sporosarcina cyprini]MCG3088367.1 (deoxy)nucleoside triphosphate pyrophosphohydrolase [Sporosarcina cyprini]
MPTPIHVVAAIIHNTQGEILCARRSPHMPLSGYWEFPGGKVEEGESPQDALIREIQEELACTIEVGSFVEDTIHSYETFSIRLETYFAQIQEGTPSAKEHSELRWVPWQELRSLDWAPADLPAVERVIEVCEKGYMNS